MRTPVIAGNWKMYKTPAESLAFFEAFLPVVAGHTRADIRLYPSITSLHVSLNATAGTHIAVGAQTMHWLNEGAYTGETSPTQLLSIGCHNVLLGHSEQRLYFGETDERINLKLRAAISHGLHPVVCIGELLSEREANRTEDVLCHQLRTAFRNVTEAECANIVIAYEPVWAIGTGRTASPEIAAEAHAIVRRELAACCGQHAADTTRILYGGSVKPDNIATLMAQPDIDGALVGGASLDPKSFAAIVNY
ncbi:MAG: triose-phosphate isomerase [Acidobacteriota bacterium]